MGSEEWGVKSGEWGVSSEQWLVSSELWSWGVSPSSAEQTKSITVVSIHALSVLRGSST